MTFPTRLCGVLAALAVASCAPIKLPAPPPMPPPMPPPAATVRTVAVVVESAGHPIVGATCAIDQAPAPRGESDAAGYLAWDGIATSRRDLQLTCAADGFSPFSEHRALITDHNEDMEPVVLSSLHVDPATFSLAQLEAFRGSLFTVKDCGLPYGPRPGQPDNIVFFGTRFYSREQRQCGYDAWKKRGYTHGVVGPFIDPGYHNQVPPNDFRSNPNEALDLVQEVWDQGLIPIVAIVPDHWGADRNFEDHVWTVDELRGSDLEAVYRSPRFQRLARVVMLCWECQGSKYGWSNAQYVGYLSWLRDTFPNAVRVLHTISDIEAPVGNGDDTSKPGMSNGESWGRVTPLIHAWFHQSNALFTSSHVDPTGDGRTDEAHWFDLFDAARSSSLVSRFSKGVAGWPTTSANPPDVNGGHLCVVAGEYMSFRVYWDNWAEQLARDHGARALSLGACGFMDGGYEAGR